MRISGLAAVVTASFLFAGSAMAAPVPVWASFSPSTVNLGQSTTFSWQGATGSICEVEGLPGGIRYGRTGTFTFAPTGTVTAQVTCEKIDQFGGASATVSVITAPTVTASFTPGTIEVGKSSQLTWSSTNATSCSSPQNGAVSGTSGSLTVPSASSGTQTQTTTINCIGPMGTASANASLTTIPYVPYPTVQVWASPSTIFYAQYVRFYWQATDATGCDRGLWGNTSVWVANSGYFYVTCWNSTKVATGAAYVYFAGMGFDAPSAKLGEAKSVNTAVKKAPVDLKHLGIDLSKKRYLHSSVDLNHDASADVIVVDQIKQQAHIVLNVGGRFGAINKTVDGVSKLEQIKLIVAPVSGLKGDISVTVEQQR